MCSVVEAATWPPWTIQNLQAFVGCAKKTCRGEDALIQRRMQTFMLALEGTKWDLTSNTSVPSKVVASSRLSHLKRRLFTGISRILMRKCLRKMTESSQREKAAGPHYTDMAAGPQTTQTETVPGPLSRVGEMKMIQAPLTSKMDPVNNEKCQNYRLVCTTISSLDKCIHCVGPGSSFKWLGYKCKVCSGVWHKSCLRKITNDDFHHPSQEKQFSQCSGGELLPDQDSTPHSEKEEISDDDQNISDEEYIPDSESHDDDDSDTSIPFVPRQSKAGQIQVKLVTPNAGTSCGSDTSIPVVPSTSKVWSPLDSHMVANTAETSDSRNSIKNSSKEQPKDEAQVHNPESTHLIMSNKNYCYICGKPQIFASLKKNTHYTC
ncbi:uncharacterized protein [Trachinotus anak]|uniref:uncharacterized protein isoform X2 n=1 Tax=Trachinotus anak TaxID=443729 RepID=UPI0039F21656